MKDYYRHRKGDVSSAIDGMHQYRYDIETNPDNYKRQIIKAEADIMELKKLAERTGIGEHEIPALNKLGAILDEIRRHYQRGLIFIERNPEPQSERGDLFKRRHW